MTDKLKCPFCGTELLSDPEYIGSEHLHCENPECVFPSAVELHSSIWQKIIDDKKAQDALKVATDFIGFVNTSRHADGALAAMAIGKLNEITSITKQDNK